ncbi:MAG: OmpA family protein [Anaeromyxobacter sp.]
MPPSAPRALAAILTALALASCGGSGPARSLATQAQALDFAITTTAVGGGTVTCTPNPVPEGTSTTCAITPDPAHHVVDVLVDGVSQGPITSYPFTSVATAHTLDATFAIDNFTITPSAGANGSISPSTAQTVSSGGSLGFTITPNTGYHVADVLVDGSSVGAVTGYTFTNVTANHTIAVTFAIDTFTITASAGANGSISPSGAVSVNSGATQAFTFTPSAGYHVASITVDGGGVAVASSYTFTNVTANHTIAVTFAIDTFTITPSAGANGTISPATATTVNYGASQTFNFTPAGGYHVASLTVDGVAQAVASSYTFTNVTANHTIAVTFAINTFTITASAGANGSISPSGAVSVNSGATQAFTFTPSGGYHVATVTVDGAAAAVASSYTFTNVTANHTIAVTFAIDTFTITASAGANGSISPSGAVGVNSGATQAFTITPNTGYHVADVLVDGSSVGAVTSHTFTNVTANHTIAASFAINTYTITPSAGANGAISPATAQTVNHGASLGFTITPNTGYHVADVLVDGVSAGAVTSYTFTNVTAAHTIAASFAINTFTITASAGANGSISPSGTVSVNYGATQAFTFTPSAGYHVASVTVDGAAVAVASSYTFTNVTANHTIAVTFAIDTFTITPSAGANGTISPATVQTVNYGATQAFTFTPSAGYHVATVTVDGAAVAVASSYTFTNVTAAHSIAVTFAIDTFTITPSAGANGTISPATVQTVNYGATANFTFTPGTGYHVASLTVDGAAVAVASSYTFTNVTANHTIAVTFAIDTFTITASAGANGSIAPTGAVSVNYGGVQTFTITPAVGYHVSDVVVDGFSLGAVTSYTFTNVTSAHTITASFAINTFTITASAGANGTISPSGAVSVNYGATQAFTFTPAANYHVATVTVDGAAVAVASSYSFTNVTANHTIAVTFAIDTFTLTPSAGANGTITPATAQTVSYGGSLTFTITPATGYHIATLAADGAAVAIASSYTFTNVTANHTLAATFAIDTFTITASAGANGTIAPSGTVTVNYGASQLFTLTPAAGYRVATLTVDGAPATAATTYTFTNVTASHTIAGTFTKANGTACATAGECGSGLCVDGVCCDLACGGQCQACDVAGKLGTCSAVTGAPHGARTACVTDGTTCGGSCNGTLATACTYPTTSCRAASCTSGVATLAAACDGAGHCPTLQTVTCAPFTCGPTACAGDCTVDANCSSSAYCAAGVCTPKKAAGLACGGANQCATGFCVDGVCCNGTCDKQCQACDVAGKLGTCSAVTGAPHGARAACTSDGSVCGGACDGTVTTACAYPSSSCRAASCTAAVATVAAACDGAGHCPAVQTVACAPYVCGPTACAGNCTGDDACVSTSFCGGGVCKPKLQLGVACGRDGECAGGRCVDGICCDGACDGQCEACDVPGQLGACKAVAGAPHGGRPACASDGTLCGGACDATSRTACAFPDALTSCRDASCTDGVATLAAVCDGAGHCPAVETRLCDPYVCGPTACAGDCIDDAQCVAGDWCSAGVCALRGADGASCGVADACASGFCVAGTCCHSACPGPDQACNLPGHQGTCTSLSAVGCRADADCPSDAFCLAGACHPRDDAAAFRVGGSGGCASTGAGDVAPPVAALLALLGLARRRRAGRALLAVAGLALSGAASAQTAAQGGFVVERFQPRFGAADVLAVESPAVPATHLQVGAGLWLDFADRPLRLWARDAAAYEVALVSNQAVANLGASIALKGRYELALAIPATLAQSGERTAAFTGLPAPATGFALSDVRLSGKARWREVGPVTLGGGLAVSLPTGSGAYRSAAGPTFGATALASWSRGPLRVLGNAGLVLRQKQELLDLTVSSALTLAAAAEWRFASGVSGLAALNAEAGLGGGGASWPAEAQLAARWDGPRGLVLTAGLGAGLTSGFGAPRWRAIAAIAFSPAWPRPPDPDEVVMMPAPAAEPEVGPPPAPIPGPPPEAVAPPEAPIDLTHLDPPRPAPGVKALLHGWRIVLFEQVQFAPGREALLPASGELLRQVAQILKDNPQIRFVQIEGHTDDSGELVENERLSQRRAEKVRDFLVGAGVAAGRLEPRGFGPTRPIAPNDTFEGRAQNRRVEFVILETTR